MLQKSNHSLVGPDKNSMSDARSFLYGEHVTWIEERDRVGDAKSSAKATVSLKIGDTEVQINKEFLSTRKMILEGGSIEKVTEFMFADGTKIYSINYDEVYDQETYCLEFILYDAYEKKVIEHENTKELSFSPYPAETMITLFVEN